MLLQTASMDTSQVWSHHVAQYSEGEILMKINMARVVAAAWLLVLSLSSLTLAQTADQANPPSSSNVTTTGGTVNAIPLFTTTTNIQSSILTQTGTTSVNVLGKLTLPATGSATAGGGKNSRSEGFVASAFNSTTANPVAQTFLLQAEAAGNNSASPSGTLNLLFGSGTATPTETGLKISNKGVITFAPGQTFAAGAGSLCVAVSGGFGNGGTTFVGPSFAVPAQNSCSQWSGYTKTASSVILSTSGSACLSTTGKTLTVSVTSADPSLLGAGSTASDYIQLTRASSSGTFTGGSDQGEFGGSANQITCTSSLLSLPDIHD
jgi:hypothetical protein